MRGLVGFSITLTLLVLAACAGDRDEGPAQPQPDASGEAVETVRTESDSASLETPAKVAVGSHFTVAWTGPDEEGDYVTIVEQGAAQGT